MVAPELEGGIGGESGAHCTGFEGKGYGAFLCVMYLHFPWAYELHFIPQAAGKWCAFAMLEGGVLEPFDIKI